METGTRSLRNVFRNGSCNDCPLAIIYLLVIESNSCECSMLPLRRFQCSRRPADAYRPVRAAAPQSSTGRLTSLTTFRLILRSDSTQLCAERSDFMLDKGA